MNPDKSSPGGDMPTPVSPGDSNVPTAASTQPNQDAAANVLRTQIDTLYGDSPVAENNTENTAPAQTTVVPTVETNIYHRTHSAHPAPQADQWKEYHSAWQNYYQKYYENYYTAQGSPADEKPTASGHYFSQTTDAEETAEELSNDQALYELRQKLLGRVKERAVKLRKSRHFIPIAAAIGVVLIFVFLQYNSVLIGTVAAYVSPGAINPQNIVVDPSKDIAVTSEPLLIIPKINVEVPVLYDVGADHNSQMAAMEKGVAHFAIPGANSHPGEIGNTAIAGHSSNDLFGGGDYKFIFAQLERLVVGDSIYANYNSKRYTYIVTKTEVVRPSEINKLIYPTDKPMLTLITCTPLGTARDRLLITAEQVNPDPFAAAPAPEGSGDDSAADESAMPGNAPTFFERLFGIGS